ncbi:hypothetical protein Bbelb_020210 [Branchiostoma belcheri]|nr:hypothetical protein Bbelb_020210 [Branchiostoma belcheri]
MSSTTDLISVIVRVVGCSGNVLTKHRSNLPLSALEGEIGQLTRRLEQHLGLKEVSAKVGILNFDTTLARYDAKTQANFAINTQAQLDLEKSLVSSQKSELVVTVKERKVLLTTGGSRIVVNVAGCSTQHRERKASSRRRKSQNKAEDQRLYEAIKSGGTVERTGRQEENLQKMKDELEAIDCVCVSELQVKCGLCNTNLKLPTDRAWKGKSTFSKRESKTAMASWLGKPSHANASASASASTEDTEEDGIPDMEDNIPDMPDLDYDDKAPFPAEDDETTTSLELEHAESITGQMSDAAFEVDMNSDRESDTVSGSDVEVVESDTASGSDVEVADVQLGLHVEIPVFARSPAVGALPQDRIFYKWLSGNLEYLLNENPQQFEWDEEVVEFYRSLKYHGGERTLNLLRGPMHLGQGRGGTKDPASAKMNLGGPSRVTVAKKNAGYTTRNVVPLIDNPTVKVIPVVMQGDGTALKPAIQFDPLTKTNVGLTFPVDLEYVKTNQEPDLKVLEEKIVSEAHVMLLYSLDGNLSMPVAVDYLAKKGKTGEVMQQMFASRVKTVQVCRRCLQRAQVKELIVEDVPGCVSHCDTCLANGTVCEECGTLGHETIHPAARACSKCVNETKQCEKILVMVLSTDCEEGNKKAMRGLRDVAEVDPSLQLLVHIPDAVHVGKSLKAGFANWFLIVQGVRVCLAILAVLRKRGDPTLRRQLKKLLREDDARNRDRMSVESVSRLTQPAVVQLLRNTGKVVYTIVPDLLRNPETNRPGMYPHIVAVTPGPFGFYLALDFNPLTRHSRLIKIRTHNPADVVILKEKLKDAHSLAYMEGVAFVCEGTQICVVPVEGKLSLNISSLKKTADVKVELEKRGLSLNGTMAQLKDRLQNHLAAVSRTYGPNSQHKKTSLNITGADMSPRAICSLDEDALLVGDDRSRTILRIQVEKDGVGLLGHREAITPYPTSCKNVMSVSGMGEHIFATFRGDTAGGVYKYNNQAWQTVALNNTDVCTEAHSVTWYGVGETLVAFTDSASHQVKVVMQSGQVQTLAGNGRPGLQDGTLPFAEFHSLVEFAKTCNVSSSRIQQLVVFA